MKGHSCRGGRSRCSPKRGPGSRAHQSRAILRRDAIRLAEDGQEQQPRPIPNLRRGVSPYATAPVRPVAEPIVTVRRIADRDILFADYSPTVH